MTTVKAIAKAAFDAVAGSITDAVHSASLSYDTQGSYNTTTGAYAITTTTLTGGSAVLDMGKPVSDIFPDYTAGPSDRLVLLQGFTSVPKENWTLTYNGNSYAIKQVLDLVDAGSVFYVVVA